MKESHYKSYDDLPLFLNAKTVAKVLGVSPSSGYELLHDPGFPVMRVGNRMVVPKEQFIQWVSDHTGGGTGLWRTGGLQFPETVQKSKDTSVLAQHQNDWPCGRHE